MAGKKKWTLAAISALFVIIVLLGLDLIGAPSQSDFFRFLQNSANDEQPEAVPVPSATTTRTSAPDPAQPAQQEQQPPQPQQPVGTISPTQPVKVGFKAEDCEAPGLVLIKAQYGPGSLRCRYENSIEFEIFERIKPEEYQQAIESNLSFRHTAFPTIQKMSETKKNYTMEIIQDNSIGVIFMETYDEPPEGETEVHLCGSGYGSLGVEDSFEVTLEVNEACGIGSSTNDYIRVITTLRDTALKAIDRAAANRGK